MKDIQIFVSSTFSDMHRERDLLHQVAGLLNRELLARGYQIVLRDLRHGVDTAGVEDEREIEKKILKECFDIIKGCHFFLLLLGDRYGSVFEDLTVPSQYLPNQELAGKSVTHLEVEYGIRNFDRDHILVFDRRFQGDLSEVPARYCESSDGMQKNRQLKVDLRTEGYFLSDYEARIQDGAFVIDEYTFLKHMQGHLSAMVKDHLKRQEPAGDGEKTVSAIPHSGTLGTKLMQEMNRKITCYPEPLRDAAKELLLLRIQNLLHKDDFDIILQHGNNGQAILEYRRSLIKGSPDDFIGLLQSLCKCLCAVTDTGEDLFRFLQTLACAQETALAQMGGISIRELALIMGSRPFSSDQTYDAWLDSRFKHSGTYRQQLPLQRALAYFWENDIILTHSDPGYLFKDCHVAAYLSESAPEAIKERIWEYAASVFWYLPDPASAWDDLMRTGRFQLCLSCLEHIRLDDRFADELLGYVKRTNCAEAIRGRLETLLSWMVEHSVEEACILYVLKICNYLSEAEDGPESDEWYQAFMVPLYQRVHDQIYEKNRGSLSAAQQYLLWYLYDLYDIELQDPPEPVLSPQQTEEMQILDGAVCELFCHHEFSDDAQLEAYLKLENIVFRYLDQPDQLIRVLRIYLSQGSPSWGCLFENLRLMALRELLTFELMLKIMAAALQVHVGGDYASSAVEFGSYYLAELAHELEDDTLCVSLLHILYDVVCAETRSRRCEWDHWAMLISCDLIDRLYLRTTDPVVTKIACIQEALLTWGWDCDTVLEADESERKTVEERRAEYFGPLV